jgi:uncharacterized protein DUF4339
MSAPASPAQWYIARDGQQFGPISEAELTKLVELGHLQPNDLVWRDGFPDWRPALVVFPPPGPSLSSKTLAGKMLASKLRAADPAADASSMAAGDGAATLAVPADHGDPVADAEARPRRWGRVVALLLIAVVLAGAGGFAYPYRAQLAGLLKSLTATSGAMAIADRKRLETPPLKGFGAGEPDVIDANLQASALWRVIKPQFPDWYTQRVNEVAQLARDKTDDAVIGQYLARKLVELRRQQVANGLSARLETLKTVATAYFDTLAKLRSHSADACYGFINRGEAEPLIVGLLQGTEHTGHLQAQLTAVFEAIAEGRQLPRVHPHPTQAQYQLLANELAKRGWTEEDFKLLSSKQTMAQGEPEKVCQLVHDFFAAQLSLPDADVQMRLLVDSLKPVFAG